MLINNFFKRKSNKYFLIFLGRFPENFKHGIKPVIDYNENFRFTFGPGSLLIIFNSRKKIHELNKIFNKVYGEYIDAFFLFDINKNNYGKYCINLINEQLFNENKLNLTNDEKIEKIHVFIDVITKMRDSINNEILNHLELNNVGLDINNTEANSSEITGNQIDSILDKINEHGTDSLSPDEQTIFNKIFKK